MIDQEKITQNIETILEELGIPYKEHSNRISLACPIHESGKNNSAAIYKGGTGTWRCWSGNCHVNEGKSVFSFIKACLSKQEGKPFSNEQTTEWLEKLLNIILDEEKSELQQTKHKTVNISLSFSKRKKDKPLLIKRDDVIRELLIPAPYFIQRGYPTEILKKYDVGFCNKISKPMSGRCVVPIYDSEYKYMVGCMGRTLKPQCEICNKFHDKNQSCPVSSIEEYLASKWINSTGFNGEDYLYNYWFAKNHIRENKTVILCEGCSDVWRLEEAGIHIGLSLFGAHLTDSQAEKLEKLPIINLVIAMDNDDAGAKARAIIKEKLWRYYNIFDIIPTTKDIGELSIEEIKNIFNPLLGKLCPSD